MKTKDEYKQREMKYLMRIAALEKDTQRLQEQLRKHKQDDQSHVIQALTEQLNAQKAENAMLKKYVSSASKTTRTNTTTSTGTVGSTSGYKNKVDHVRHTEYVPSYMLALQLAEGK